MRVRSLDCPALTRTPVTPASGSAATASISPNGSASVCAGGSVRLQANTGPDLTYQWFRNGARLTGATSSTLQASSAGDYTVQVANGCPAVQSAPVTVSIRSAQSPVVVANGLVLTSDATSGIQWFRDGAALPGATASSYTAVQSGRYSVRGNVNGCGESLSNDVFITITATEPDPQEAELVVYPNPTSRQLTVRLTGVSARTDAPTVRLVDQRGSTLLQADMQRDGKSYSTVLDISALPGGTFFVVIDEARESTVRLKRIRKL
ncbi:T9SS type A sorting domain-containing protein [Spirosoma montaniterrae]|uniref:T9SS type A sorting domain-containing protein n=1 Tax=Spirosoma montaniterrae TaxID=1178516 RepID=UPI00269EB245